MLYTLRVLFHIFSVQSWVKAINAQDAEKFSQVQAVIPAQANRKEMLRKKLQKQQHKFCCFSTKKIVFVLDKQVRFFLCG